MKIVTLAMAVLISGCSMCGNDPINVDVSPNKELVAIAFIRDCGATTSYSTQVSILEAPGKLPNEAGNVYITKGKHPIEVRWRGNSELLIIGAGNDEQFSRNTEYQGINVSYR